MVSWAGYHVHRALAVKTRGGELDGFCQRQVGVPYACAASGIALGGWLCPLGGTLCSAVLPLMFRVPYGQGERVAGCRADLGG